MTLLKNSKRQRKQLKMMIKKVIILAAILISGLVSGQDEEKVLFSIEGNPVYNAEFIRVFEKNKDIIVEDERKDFDDYFDLFVDFRLKLMQARDCIWIHFLLILLIYLNTENNLFNLIYKIQRQQRIGS